MTDSISKKIPLDHPGILLLEEFMEPHGINASQLARMMDIDRNRISQIIRGKRDITADTALRLSLVFGTTARFWMNLQSHYDLEKEKEIALPALQKSITPFSETILTT